MSLAPVKQKNTVYYINTCITIIFFLGIGHLPPFGQITPMGMKVLAVFIGMLYGWLTVVLLGRVFSVQLCWVYPER